MKIITFLIRFFLTLLLVCVAVFAGWRFWGYYMESPWTRDARVRVNVVPVAPDVAGIVSEVFIKDNQRVKKGDRLLVIDQARFRLALQEAEATLNARASELEQRKREAERRRGLIESRAVTKELFEQAENAVVSAKSALDQAVIARDIAALNMERTAVRSPVNGFVTNLQLDTGDYATVGKPLLALVNSDSFYIAGYFEETKISRIHEGDKVIIHLMGMRTPLDGRVDSIARAIADRDNVEATNLVANVNPTFTWVRLAQRIPVRISIDKVPDGVRLSAGMTATVTVVETDKKSKH